MKVSGFLFCLFVQGAELVTGIASAERSTLTSYNYTITMNAIATETDFQAAELNTVIRLKVKLSRPGDIYELDIPIFSDAASLRPLLLGDAQTWSREFWSLLRSGSSIGEAARTAGGA